MKKQLLTGVLVVGTLIIFSAFFPGSADASSLKGSNSSKKESNESSYSLATCPDEVLSLVSDTTRCQYIDPQTGSLNDRNTDLVNNLKFFERSGWIISNEDEYFKSGGESGTNSFSLINFNWKDKSDVLLVFKGGNDTTLVGYLLDRDNTDGTFTWTQPWEKLYGKAKDVSHISLYYRQGGTTPIPTPALLPGLIGMGVAALRKKKQEETAQNA